MVQGMSRDAWDEFSKTILVRYVLSYLSGTLYLDPSTSLKRIFAFSTGVFLAFQHMPQLAWVVLTISSQYYMTKLWSFYPQIVKWLRVRGVWNY